MRRAYQRNTRPLHERQCDISAHFVAHSDATRADDAQVVVAVVQRVVSMNRQVAAVVIQRRAQVQLDQSHRVLEFAPLILRADGATVSYVDVALTHILRTAELNAVACQATVRVLGHQQLDNATP